MHAGRAVAVVVVAGIPVSMLLDAFAAPGWMVLVVFLIGVLLAMRYVRAAVRRDVGGG